MLVEEQEQELEDILCLFQLLLYHFLIYYLMLFQVQPYHYNNKNHNLDQFLYLKNHLHISDCFEVLELKDNNKNFELSRNVGRSNYFNGIDLDQLIDALLVYLRLNPAVL